MTVTVKNTLPKEYKNAEERKKEIQRIYIEVQNAMLIKQTCGQLKRA
nr:hypothetical protein [uncultured Anaerocolumna sp.]